MNSILTSYCEVFITQTEEVLFAFSDKSPEYIQFTLCADQLQSYMWLDLPGGQEASWGSDGTDFSPDLTPPTVCYCPL